ncbi:hypothetical protein [Bacteroides finegoldii]|uniref:hypothetical protein n=1 Tax=Bacteroides finegoldii TaxID=338188 RepID=UPI00189D5344|nr:hypothetical protein [Bacteroides finegoldii]
MNYILKGLHAEKITYRKDYMPKGLHAEWTLCRMDPMPNGLYAEWFLRPTFFSVKRVPVTKR